MTNRSVPANVLLPHIVYSDTAAAMQRLKAAFGRAACRRAWDGERQYRVLDPEQHHWLFSRHAHEVNPGDWSGIVANPK